MHRDVKAGFRTTLHHIGDRYGEKWSQMLPWILLAKNSAYQPELGTSPAELVLGQMPRLPGDVLETNGQRITELIEDLRNNASRPPVQTAHHRSITVFTPKEMEECTHVYTKVGKPSQLGSLYEGPYPIIQRIGKSVLKIKVGNWANGSPRHEITHWNNAWPAPPSDEPLVLAEKPRRGRKPLNANAPSFHPA